MSEPRMKVMVVDDEPDVGKTLKLMLEDYEFDVDSFIDSLEALDFFRPKYYALLILDIRMPKMNGFELYVKMKSLDRTLKVLFLTALTHLYDYSQFKTEVYPKLHERHFLQKPITQRQLLEQVYSIVN